MKDKSFKRRFITFATEVKPKFRKKGSFRNAKAMVINMEKDYTKVLAEFCHLLKYSDLPPKTVPTIKYLIIDCIASAMAGKRINKNFNHACEKLVFLAGGNPQAHTLFSDVMLPVENAAFMNSVYAHGADMDDGNRKAMGHVGAHVIPAVMALAETLSVSEKDIIVSIAVGYEIYCRTAAAVQPGLVRRGFHSTGTAGALACAAACAKLMGLDSEGIYNSMALATTQSSGLLIVAESGQSCKPINPARAAQSGIISAKLVSYGVKSFDNPLQSSKGWFHAMSDSVDYSMLTCRLGESFAADECYFKPYPSCRHTHCSIQAALELKNEHPFSADEIEKVNVYIYKNAIDIAGQIKLPRCDDDSKFSIHYTLASALFKGNFTLSDLDVSDIPQEILSLIEKIELIEDSSMENRDAGIRGSRVEIMLCGGSKIEKKVLIPKGDPENPFTLDDLKYKTYSCCEGILTKGEADTLIFDVMNSGTDRQFDISNYPASALLFRRL